MNKINLGWTMGKLPGYPRLRFHPRPGSDLPNWLERLIPYRRVYSHLIYWGGAWIVYPYGNRDPIRNCDLGPGQIIEACGWLLSRYPSTWFREHWVMVYGDNAEETDRISREEYERIKRERDAQFSSRPGKTDET